MNIGQVQNPRRRRSTHENGLSDHIGTDSRESRESSRGCGRLFQALAICKLIAEADVRLFREHLTRSAQARRYYLRKSVTRTISTIDFSVSPRTVGFRCNGSRRHFTSQADRVALRPRVARKLGVRRRFLYYLFVHRLIEDIAFVDSSEATGLIARFERALEGQRSPRLALLKALKQRGRVGVLGGVRGVPPRLS
jgi:hypothetical protein